MRRPAMVSRSWSGRLQRLSPLDVSNLRAEEHGVPMHVAALARVEGAPLNQPPLDRSRPLWELWLLHGLADGTIGMLIRLHHAVADGIAAIVLMGALFDTTQAAPPPAAPPWQPAPAPSTWQLFTDDLRLHACDVAAAAAGLRHRGPVIDRIGSRVRQMRLLAREGRAPRLSLNQPAGMGRRLLLARADLAQVKAAAHMHGATVNDLGLAAVADGTHRLLAGRGELRPGLVLKASVAAAARDPAGLAASGNRAAIMLVPLPVGEPDPGRRLGQIAEATRERKRHPPYQPGGRLAQRWMVHAMSRQRLVNLFTSNLPGPPQPLYFAGAQILEIFQAGVVQGNVTIAVGVLSYAGQLNFTIVGDADAVPDLKAFADGLTDALTQFGGKRPRAGPTAEW
jgi:diacylglycerol O-acyltransferase